MSDDWAVNGLVLPPLLQKLMREGKWKHPGHDVIRQVAPSLKEEIDEVVFLQSIEDIRFASSGHLADSPHSSQLMHEIRGSKSVTPPELPWLDDDKAVLIAVCRVIGADVAIALDYRTSHDDPRVVASDWYSPDGHLWREVTSTFSEFVKRIGLDSEGVRS